jgi:hypothetical protein
LFDGPSTTSLRVVVTEGAHGLIRLTVPSVPVGLCAIKGRIALAVTEPISIVTAPPKAVVDLAIRTTISCVVFMGSTVQRRIADTIAQRRGWYTAGPITGIDFTLEADALAAISRAG